MFLLKHKHIDLSAAVWNIKILFYYLFFLSYICTIFDRVEQKLYSVTNCPWGNMRPVLHLQAVPLGLGDSMLSNLQICKAHLELLLVLCPEQQIAMFTLQVNRFTQLGSLPVQNSIKAIQSNEPCWKQEEWMAVAILVSKLFQNHPIYPTCSPIDPGLNYFRLLLLPLLV